MRYYLVIIVLAVIIIPLTGVGLSGKTREQQTMREKSSLRIGVETEQGDMVMGVTEYLTGVVAAQIPADYEMETLKAQAVMARTCLYECVGGRNYVNASEVGMSRWSEQERRHRWGRAYKNNNERIAQAVIETDGQILRWNEGYIYPSWFAVGTGTTRSSLEAWGVAIPWLQATDSEWDKESEDYAHTIVKSKRQFIEEMHQNYRDFECSTDSLASACQITKKDDMGYVQEIQIGNKLLKGEDFRYAMGLSSSAFTLKFEKNSVYIAVYGEGHGVGFDQYGANRQAMEGKRYDELLQYYLKDVKVTE